MIYILVIPLLLHGHVTRYSPESVGLNLYIPANDIDEFGTHLSGQSAYSKSPHIILLYVASPTGK